MKGRKFHRRRRKRKVPFRMSSTRPYGFVSGVKRVGRGLFNAAKTGAKIVGPLLLKKALTGGLL